MIENKILAITGITGFVGQNLKKYLAPDFLINELSRKPNEKRVSYESFLNSKIPYDTIIHLAGKAHDLKKTANDHEYYKANYELTKQLFDSFLQSQATTFIYISSVKAVADRVKGILTEEVEANPITVYGKSKKMAEDYILSHLPEGKRVYILRPCMIHGPGNKGNLNLLYQIVAKGIPWPLGSFENKRSFLGIENFCFVIKELLVNKTIPSGVYNLSDDLALSTNELIVLLGELLGKNQRIIKVPKILVHSLANIGDMIKLPLNSERLDKLTENYQVSNFKIVSAMNKSIPISAVDGLRATFKSFKEDL